MKVMLCALMVAVVALPAWAILGDSDSIPPVREAAQFAAELQVGEVQAEWGARLTRRSISFLEGLKEEHGSWLWEILVANSPLTEPEYDFARRVALGLRLLETEEYDLGYEALLALASEGDVRAGYAFAARLADEVGFYDAWKYLAQFWRADELVVKALQDAWILLHQELGF